MGRLIIPKTRNYLYKTSGIGLSPNINNLKFYDSGLIYNGKKSFYSEDGQYAIWYSNLPNGLPIWIIGSIANIGTFTVNSWGKLGASNIIIGSYPAGSYVGTVTISEYKNNISIKKQNFTNFIVSEGSILPPGIDPNGVYLLQNSLINGKSWYISNQGINIRIVSSISSIWAMQYLLNNWLPLTSSTNPAANPWEATWPSNIQVSFSNGKISLF